MDISKVLIEYDNMFGVNSMSEIEEFLVNHIERAMEEKDYNSALSLMNEMMSLCRDTSQNAKGLHYCTLVEDMLVKLGLEGTVEYGTSLINVANAYRAFGYNKKAENLFERVEVIYREKLPAGDFLFASLYNNWSLMYQQTEEFSKAEEFLRKALRIINLQENALIEQATTRCNLATTLLRIAGGSKLNKEGDVLPENKKEPVYDEAVVLLQEALRMFEWDGQRDFHYSGALSAMGDALYYKKDYEQSAKYYEQAMEELEKRVGKTEAYMTVAENCERAKRKAEEAEKIRAARAAEKEAARAKAEAEGAINADGTPNVEGGIVADHFEDEEEESTPVLKVHRKVPNGPIMDLDDAFGGSAEAEFMSKRHGVKTSYEKPAPKKLTWVEVCKLFYEEEGAPMIHADYPEYENRIAVGLVGDGSDCFGFDDAISRDHDYGIGFCMWLSDEDFKEIGAKLQESYENLIKYRSEIFFEQHQREAMINSVNVSMDSRRGVFGVREFYENTLGSRLTKTEEGDLVPDHWMQISEDKLAVATNGMVFRDDEGTFSKIRETLLEYYPTQVWMLRLAEKLHLFSQTAQSNYSRMMARRDYVAANLCVGKGIKAAMEIAYLLNQTYAPYYKWMHKGMQKLTILKKISPVLENIAVLPNQANAWQGKEYNPYEINKDDAILMQFEELAEMILMELRIQGVVKGKDTFLDVYCNDLIRRAMSGDFGGVDDEEMNALYQAYMAGAYQGRSEIDLDEEDLEEMDAMEVDTLSLDQDEDEKPHRVFEWGQQENAIDREEVIAEIVEEEWKQFDKVENEGGRADCQNDWNTFSIMRKSQYQAWPDELLVSFLKDLKDAKAKGWNLITEKYARMMKTTSPAKYEELKDTLPERSEEREKITEEIVRIQVEWMEEFSAKYPKMAGNARSIHTSADTEFNTSYETYLRGEIGTYSEETFVLYGRFISELMKKDENLAYNIMSNTAVLYGYANVDDAEKRM